MCVIMGMKNIEKRLEFNMDEIKVFRDPLWIYQWKVKLSGI